jgi:hypothetical protein
MNKTTNVLTEWPQPVVESDHDDVVGHPELWSIPAGGTWNAAKLQYCKFQESLLLS